MDRRVLLPVLATVLGCGGVKSMMSNVDSAKLGCERCQPGMAVAVGVPIAIKLDWDRCSELDRNCDPSVPPFSVELFCEGATCTSEDTGGGYYEVTPTAPGTATIVLVARDQKRRELRIGPVEAVEVDAIELACTFIRPGGGIDDHAPCGDAVPAGSDIYVEIVARAGDRRVANPVPRDVSVDGRMIYQAGQMVGGADWDCKPSIQSSDPRVPNVTRCHKATAGAGKRWTLEAQVPALKLTGSLAIKVAK